MQFSSYVCIIFLLCNLEFHKKRLSNFQIEQFENYFLLPKHVVQLRYTINKINKLFS